MKRRSERKVREEGERARAVRKEWVNEGKVGVRWREKSKRRCYVR